MKLPRRSLITGAAGAAMLAAMREQADAANVPFTTFPFKASGSNQTARTQPDRLAEVKNVLDFGADPTGAADSGPAIQAAVNWTGGPNRGTIYFPLGSYKVDTTVTFNYNGNLSICFRGEGQGSLIFSSANTGFLFDRHNTNSGAANNTTGGRVFEKFAMQNTTSTGGCVRIGSTIGAFFRDCTFAANTCVTTEDSVGVSSENILFEDCTFNANGTASPTNGIVIGGGGVIMGCDFVSADTHVRAYGSGLHICGCRAENGNTGYLLGLDSGNNNVGLTGFSITSGTCEGNTASIDFAGTCSGFLIGPYGIQGHNSGNSGYPLGGQNSQYGINMRAGNASAGTVSAISVGSEFDVAGIWVGNASSRANIVFIGVTSAQSGSTGVGWSLQAGSPAPTNAFTAFFQNCNISPVWTFSQLPTGGNVLEGDEFNISDGTNSLAWGATATNTGSHTTHYLVRYNGTNYTVVGK